MGILRTILAIAVVVYHSNIIFGLRLCGGQVAVETFYMISGFYMALILNEKYLGEARYKKFILSRFYRIFPVYWFILGCAVLLSLIGYCFFNSPYYLWRYTSGQSCLSMGTVIYFIVENLIVFGQDVLYFLKLDDQCHPQLTKDVLSYNHTGYQYLFVPQAWSISLECLFYLIAPFLVTKKIKWQMVLIVAGLAIKGVFAYVYYLKYDPWTYRFFPFELAYFLIGSIGYRYYKHIEFKAVSPKIGYSLLILCVLGVATLNLIPLPDVIKNNVFYALVAFAIPYMFLAFKDNSADRYIGELSFSIYISHHLIVSLLRKYFFSHVPIISYYGYAVVILSLILAFILQQTLIKSIDKYRVRKFS